MSILYKLIILNIKNTFGLSVLRDQIRRREKVGRSLLMVVAIIISIASFAFIFANFADALVITGSQFGQPEIVFTLAITVVQLMLLILGIFLVISSFYFSDDLSILVPMPLKPSYIFAGKLVTVIISEYLTAIFIFLPAIISYTRYVGANLWYILTLIIVFLTMPILPVVISSLLALGLMKVINRRHRDLLMVIGSILLVFISLGFSMFMQTQVGDDPGALAELLSRRYGLVESIGQRFPPSIWATKAIARAGTGEGWLHLGLFLAVSVVAVLVLSSIAERLFYAGLIGGSEVIRKRRQLSQSEWEAKTQQKSVFSALFWREWRLLLRTPVFALNGFLGALIMPVALVMPLLVQGGDQLSELLALVQTEPGSTICTLIVAAIILFTSSVNTIASTSVSREGRLFYISKMIPVHAETQARAKLTHAFVGIIIGVIPISIAYVWLVRPNFLDFVAAILIGLTGSLLGMAFGLYIDMRWPRLHWTNPQQAVKQNFNAVIPMLLEFAVLLASGYLAYRLIAAEVPAYLIYAAFLGLYTIPGVIVLQFTVGAARRLYHELDI
ncbi:MAG: hypothetical protein GX060_02750 [Firmicutes bacterium]|nr:hypothetical protein [Bacillota bacterium]